MANLSTKLPWAQANPLWAAQLNPVLANPLSTMNILTGIKLAVGNNVINHLLGQQQQGWIITDINGASTIYRSAPFNELTLTLNSSAIVTVNIGVF